LSEKAGRLSFQVRRETVEGKDINRIDIQVTEAEGIELSLFEPLLNLDLPVTITVNGAPLDPPIDAKTFERDWGFFLDNMLGLRFFMLPVLGQVSVRFPLKPQFASPGDAKPAEGTPAGDTPPPGEADTEKKAAGR
jgi:hypothetical protein